MSTLTGGARRRRIAGYVAGAAAAVAMVATAGVAGAGTIATTAAATASLARAGSTVAAATAGWTGAGTIATAAAAPAGLTGAGTTVTAAAATGACPGRDTGVTVVVDFSGFRGSVQTRCAPGDPSTGLAALTGAGFDYKFGTPGLVCRIDGLPDPCNGWPADAYWSYWHAPRGGSWTYSSRGAGDRNPPPGTVEGWAFGAGDPPGIAPPAAPRPPPPPPPPPPPAPPPPAPPPPGEPPPAGQAPPATGAGSPPERDLGGEPTAGPGDGVATASPTVPGSAPDRTGSGAPEETPAGDVGLTGSTTGTGSVAGIAVAVVLVGALAGGGLWVARRRRPGRIPSI